MKVTANRLITSDRSDLDLFLSEQELPKQLALIDLQYYFKSDINSQSFNKKNTNVFIDEYFTFENTLIISHISTTIFHVY